MEDSFWNTFVFIRVYHSILRIRSWTSPAFDAHWDEDPDTTAKGVPRGKGRAKHREVHNLNHK